MNICISMWADSCFLARVPHLAASCSPHICIRDPSRSFVSWLYARHYMYCQLCAGPYSVKPALPALWTMSSVEVTNVSLQHVLYTTVMGTVQRTSLKRLRISFHRYLHLSRISSHACKNGFMECQHAWPNSRVDGGASRPWIQSCVQAH